MKMYMWNNSHRMNDFFFFSLVKIQKVILPISPISDYLSCFQKIKTYFQVKPY